MPSYQDPVILRLIKFFDAEGPASLRGNYFHGEIELPAKEQLPVAYVAKDQTIIGEASNMEDEHNMPMVVSVLYDYTRDLQESYQLAVGATSLYELMEARNTDYSLRTDSLAYVARKYQVLDSNLWIGVGTPVTINYGFGDETRGVGIFSIEATMRFTVRLHTPKPGF